MTSVPHELDVRPILRQGGEPFGAIMAAVAALAPGQPLRLLTTFKPIPLFQVLGAQGFDASAREIGDGGWETIFTPAGVTPKAAAAAGVPASNGAAQAWPDPDFELDLHDLDPPEPMVRALEGVEALPAGRTMGRAPAARAGLPRRGTRSPRALLAGHVPAGRQLSHRHTQQSGGRRGMIVERNALAGEVEQALWVIIDPELGGERDRSRPDLSDQCRRWCCPGGDDDDHAWLSGCRFSQECGAVRRLERARHPLRPGEAHLRAGMVACHDDRIGAAASRTPVSDAVTWLEASCCRRVLPRCAATARDRSRRPSADRCGPRPSRPMPSTAG
jgi:hypothetical protein